MFCDNHATATDEDDNSRYVLVFDPRNETFQKEKFQGDELDEEWICSYLDSSCTEVDRVPITKDIFLYVNADAAITQFETEDGSGISLFEKFGGFKLGGLTFIGKGLLCWEDEKGKPTPYYSHYAEFLKSNLDFEFTTMWD